MLCHIGFDDDRVIKDFIRIHVEDLSGEKILLSGCYPDYQWRQLNVRKLYEQSSWLRRCAAMLPYAFNVRRLIHLRASPDAASSALARFWRAQSVDVILAEFGETGAAVAPTADKCGIPLVVHFHGHDAHRSSLLTESMMRQYRFMFQKSAAIIVVSRYMRDTILAAGCLPEKLIYNPYGPRSRFFSVRPDYRAAVLSVGRFTDIKANYLVLMAFRRALKHVPGARLMMVGAGELLETCRTLAQVWQIEHAVEFHGAIEHGRVHELFSNACCFAQHSVSPSYGDAEGTPNTILEACAASLPVVGTRHAGIPDVVVHGKTGLLVDERDVDGMAEHMVELLRDPERCRVLGENARERIRRHFTAEGHVARLDEAIRCARNRDAAGIARLAKESLKVGIDE